MRSLAPLSPSGLGEVTSSVTQGYAPGTMASVTNSVLGSFSSGRDKLLLAAIYTMGCPCRWTHLVPNLRDW